ncbi:MAG: metallophosphoesterase [Actinomycetota bacterium]
MPGIMANLGRTLAWSGLAVGGVGSLCVLYGTAIERRWYRSRRYRLDSLPRGSSALTILHLSDLHFVRGDARKARFLSSLPRPDLTVLTGDVLGEPRAVEDAVAALSPVRGRFGSYVVLGSNDYFAPRPLNYANYFRKRRRRRAGIRGRSADLVRLLEADGWTYLRNGREVVNAGGTRVEVLGLDDPHIERHDLRVAPRTEPDAFGLAVVHSPDPAPELAALGYDLVLSGHTHGGQVRLPGVGALVTNSDIPTRLAMGLSRLGPTLLHVSPGLGTSKFAPFRFLCRPEATLMELAPQTGPDQPAAGDSAVARSNARS